MLLTSIVLSAMVQANIRVASNNAFSNILLDVFLFGLQIFVLLLNKQKPSCKLLGINVKQINGIKVLLDIALAFILVTVSFLILLLLKVIRFEGSGFSFYSNKSIWKFVGILFVQMVFVAVAEEVLFRGVIANYMKQLWGKRIALILSTLVFTAFHCMVIQSVTQVTDILVLGFLLGFFYLKTDSLIYSIVFHFGIDFATNLSGMKASKALFIISSQYSDNYVTSKLFGVMSIMGGIVLVLIILYYYLKSKKEVIH